MFNTIAHCFIAQKHVPQLAPKSVFQDKPIHGIALGADWLISGAILTIGALSLAAILWGAMPIAAQWTLVGAGGFLTICTFVKTAKTVENRWCTPRVNHRLENVESSNHFYPDPI